MRAIITTKYRLGDKFTYNGCLSSEPKTLRIGYIHIKFLQDGGIDVVYKMQEKGYDGWVDAYGPGALHITFKENDKYTCVKEIPGETYVGKVHEIDTGCFDNGDEVIYQVNGCELGEGAYHSGSIFEIDTIIYTEKFYYSHKNEHEEVTSYISYGYTDIDNIKVDGFGRRINDGTNCKWRLGNDFYTKVWRTDLVDWNEVMEKVIKFYKTHHDNPFTEDSPYLYIFRYLGMEEKFEKEWDSYQVVVKKRTPKPKKPSKVDDIIAGLSDKERIELLKKLSK